MSMTTTSTAVAAGAPDLKRVYVHDGCGSRVMRQVSRWNTAGTVWLLAKELRYLDEGSNLVAEVASLKPGSTTVRATKPLRSYQWGEDLSGTETGGGGVGGLLWCLDCHATSQTSYWQMAPWYDGNGNILGWIENHAAQIKALRRIEYDPFGRPLTSDPPRKRAR